MQQTQADARSHTLLALLGDDEWEELRSRLEKRTFAPGEVLIAQGTIGPDFHVISHGMVTISAESSDGVRHELGELGPDEAVGDMSLLTGEPASADATAATAVTTYCGSPERIATLGDLRTRLIEVLAAQVAGRLRRANERLLSQYSATTHGIFCDASILEALVRLPSEIARCVDAPILTIVAGDEQSAAWVRLNTREAPDVTIRPMRSAEVDELPRLLRQVKHEYERILVIGEAPSDICQSNLTLLREEEPANGRGRAAVVTHRRWTPAGLRALSQQAGGSVVAMLPPSSPPRGPRDPVARLARLITDRRVGVALGAGAAKGFAHIGVLKALEEMGVPVDMLSGCSIGAAMAAGYAAGYSIDELIVTGERIASRAVRPTLPFHSFLSSKGLRDELERAGRGRRFEDLDIPLAICATDIYRRCEVTFTSGLVWPRVLASMAIPGIYPALRSTDSYFVDGGVLNPMPSRQCRDLGAGIVIGVRLTATRTSPREELDEVPSRPLAPETIMRCLEIMHNRLSELTRNEADVSIEVCLEHGGMRDFDRSVEIVNAGYAAAMAARADLRVALPYVEAAS